MAKFPSLNWCWVSSEVNTNTGLLPRWRLSENCGVRHIPRAGLVNASFRFFFPGVGGRHQRI